MIQLIFVHLRNMFHFLENLHDKYIDSSCFHHMSRYDGILILDIYLILTNSLLKLLFL
jgi:hypothetical protein